MGHHEWKSCIDACLACAAVCNHCASECTQEDDVKMMAKCISLDMQCASICYAAAQLMSLGSEHAKAMCKICAEAAKLVTQNAANTAINIVRNVHHCVRLVLKNVDKWLLNFSDRFSI